MIFCIACSFVTLEADYGCIIYYSRLLPYFVVLSNGPFNTFCMGIFTYVAYVQYRKYGLSSWHHLAKNGTQIMLLILLSNLCCDIAIVLEIAGPLSEMFFLVEW